MFTERDRLRKIVFNDESRREDDNLCQFVLPEALRPRHANVYFLLFVSGGRNHKSCLS